MRPRVVGDAQSDCLKRKNASDVDRGGGEGGYTSDRVEASKTGAVPDDLEYD